MIKYVVAHRKDFNNIGDMASNPLQYFLDPDEYQTIDVANLSRDSYPLDVPMIVGGGGLMGNAFLGNVIADLLLSPDELQLKNIATTKWKLSNEVNSALHQTFKTEFGKLIETMLTSVEKSTAPKYIWGAGHNADVGESLIYPEEINQYNEIGLRDYNVGRTWAPCASCMHPAFDKKYKARHRVIWFEHKKQLIKDRAFGPDPILRFTNTGNDIFQTIELLGSAEVVLTNSYHGAYWATLLGRKVIVVGPWSTKFSYMKHPPVQISADQSWHDVVDQTIEYPDALEECRAATEEFWKKIQ